MPKKPPLDQAQFRVGDAMVHPERLVISINDEEHSIEPRIMEVLIALASAAQNNETLSAVNLYIRAWIGGAHAEGNAPDPRIDVMQAENPVHKAITHLRKVFGDDPKSPRYIETIRKRGYRLVAPVVYQDHYRRVAVARKNWTTGSPYVGLNAFDSRHASVFLGRSRTTGELIEAVRRQIDQQRRLVLVVGASGCGKTSLVNAGAIPILTEKGGYDGLRALSVARCDLAGTRREDALPRLAAALMQWTLDRREILPPQPVETLAGTLRGQPESLPDTLEDAFRRHASRDMSALSHPHLLLVIDHAEAIVADPSFGSDDHAEIDRFLHHLCESRHVCVIVIVRGDFYLALAEALPGMTERKSGDGHVDVLAPRTGEIGDIIRIPAASAGLEFQQHPESKDYLDDVLLRAAVAQPDALPLLQHTLQMLYERRNGRNQLCFDAYHEIGGLEGALSHHAEHVFTGLPDEIQASLDQVLSRMVVMQPENDRVSARRIPRGALDARAIALAEAFVQARLFVAEHENGDAHYRVAHEALLRQWSRAADWIRENLRILVARIRLQRAAARWDDEGRRDDHLLNPGAQLEEATNVRQRMHDVLSDAECDFILRSQRQQQQRKRIRKFAAFALATMAITSTAMAFVAHSMRDIAEHQETKSTNLTSFIIGEFSERLDPTGNLVLIESVSSNILRYCNAMKPSEATVENLINCSRASRKLGEVMTERSFPNTAFALFMQSKMFSENAERLAPSSIPTLLESGQSAAWVGIHHQKEGQLVLALLAWKDYEKRTRRLRAIAPLDPGYMMEASYATTNLASLERDLGLTSEARATIHHSIALKTTATGVVRNNDEWTYELIVSTSILAGLMESQGKLHDADRIYSDLIEQLERMHRKHQASREWERQLTSLRQFGAMLSLDLGDIDGARAHITDATLRLSRLAQADPDNTKWRRLQAQAHLFASDIERIDGNHPASARQLAHAASAITHPMLNFSAARRIRASILLRSGLQDGGEAGEKRTHNAINELQDLVAGDGNDRRARLALAEALVLRAENDIHEGRTASAERDARHAIDVLDASGTHPQSLTTIALRLRAMAITGTLPEAARSIEYLANAGYRHPELTAALRRQPDHSPIHDASD